MSQLPKPWCSAERAMGTPDIAVGHQNCKPLPMQTCTVLSTRSSHAEGPGGGQLQAHAGGISGSWLCVSRVPNGVGQAAPVTLLIGSRPDWWP